MIVPFLALIVATTESYRVVVLACPSVQIDVPLAPGRILQYRSMILYGVSLGVS